MPLKSCSSGGKDGYRWGDSGKCYTHDGSESGKKTARKKAIKQGLAVGGGKLNADPSLPNSPTYADTTTVPDHERSFSKACSACGKTKGDHAFPDDGRTKDGLAGVCKACKDGGRSYAALETVDIPGVDIMAAGVTVHGGGSPPEGDTYSVEKLAELATASNAVAADLRPPVKIGHNPKQRLLANSGLSLDERPAAGYLENFRVDGDKLLCDLKDVPRKLADLVESKAFRFRSAEVRPLKHQRSDTEYKAVVSGLALLGATAPAFHTLDDIHKWYAGVSPEASTEDLIREDMEPEDGVGYAVGDVLWDSEDGVNDIMSDIANQLNPGVGDWRYWVMDMQLVDVDGDGDVPGPRALIGESGSDRTWLVPFTFENGEPKVAAGPEWILVSQEWVQAADNPGVTEPATQQTDFRELSNALSRLQQAGLENADARVVNDIRRAFALPVQGNGPAADTTATMPDTKPKQKPTAEDVKLSDEQVKAFAELYDLGEDATAEAVIDKMFANAPEPPTPPPAPPAPGPDDPPTRTFSEDEAKQLLADAAAGRKAYAEREAEKKDSLFREAVSEGRMEPSQVKTYAERYDKDPEFIAQVVKDLPVNEEWKRVYGSDEDDLVQGDGAAAERAYAEYCATAGIPYYPAARSAA